MTIGKFLVSVIGRRGGNLATTLSAAIAMVAALFFTQSAAAAQDCKVRVAFDSNKCPVMTAGFENPRNYCDGAQVSSLVLSADKDEIQWVAYNADFTARKTDVSYKIFFDPFSKAAAEAKPNRDGLTDVKKTKKSNEIPVNVDFKYTIWSDDCPQAPLDPRFKVI